MTDRRGKTTYYDRDELGRVTKIIDPLNHTTQYTYCGCGGPNHHRRPEQGYHHRLQQCRLEDQRYLRG